MGVILVVEDEVLVRMDLANALSSTGFDVVEAANADEALTMLRGELEVALVVTDIQMPGQTDGHALIGWLRRERPNVRTIIVSGHETVESMTKRADAGFTKPVNMRSLARRAAELMHQTQE